MAEVKIIGQMDNTIDHTFESANRVYDTDGISPTVNTCGGGGLQPKVVEVKKMDKTNVLGNLQPETNHQSQNVYSENGVAPNVMAGTHGYGMGYLQETKSIKVRQATKQGFIECPIGGVADLSYPTSTLRRGRVQGNGQISPTLTTENIPSVIELGNPEFYNFLYEIDGEIYLIRIRKLTPKECWSLMNFNPGAFYKAEKVNSNTQLYKQAGNSIVVNCLVAIFGQMFDGKENIYKEVNK